VRSTFGSFHFCWLPGRSQPLLSLSWQAIESTLSTHTYQKQKKTDTPFFKKALVIWSWVPETTLPLRQLYWAFICGIVFPTGRVKVNPVWLFITLPAEVRRLAHSSCHGPPRQHEDIYVNGCLNFPTTQGKVNSPRLTWGEVYLGYCTRDHITSYIVITWSGILNENHLNNLQCTCLRWYGTDHGTANEEFAVWNSYLYYSIICSANPSTFNKTWFIFLCSEIFENTYAYHVAWLVLKDKNEIKGVAVRQAFVDTG